MNSDSKKEHYRDSEVAKRKSGISPTTQAATEWKAAQHLGEAMDRPGATTPPGSEGASAAESAAHSESDPAKRGEPRPAANKDERSPKQENL